MGNKFVAEISQTLLKGWNTFQHFTAFGNPVNGIERTVYYGVQNAHQTRTCHDINNKKPGKILKEALTTVNE